MAEPRGRGSSAPRRRPLVAGERRRPVGAAQPAAALPEAPPAATEPPVGAPTSTALGRRPRPTLGWVMLGVVLLLLASTAWAALQVQGQRAEEAARRQALSAARTDAEAIFSYDYRRLDADFAKARAVIAGSFRDDYDRTTASVVRPTATRYKAVVKAEVVEASMVRASRHRAVVLLFVNQTTTSTRLDGPKIDVSRVRLRLAEVGGAWKVTGVEAL